MKINKFFKTFIVIVVIIAVLLVIKLILTNIETSNNVTTAPISDETQIEYMNSQYGFKISLPDSWKGYTIVDSKWQGNTVDSTPGQSYSGPEISIRNPLWTLSNPRQDIPIMIFTPDEWQLIQDEKLSVSAAPIGPSELGHNDNYYFALPARYNYAFLPGFEEVEQIINDKSFQAF